MMDRHVFGEIERLWFKRFITFSFNFQINQRIIRLVSDNATVAQKFARAFLHLEVKVEKTPDLTITIWEIGAAEKLPSIDWKNAAKDLISNNDYYYHASQDAGVVSILSFQKNSAHFVMRDVDILPWWLFASPFQPIMHAWSTQYAFVLTHTAAISDDHSAILLCGKGGSGKSTTTLACLRNGFDYLGEDYTVLSIDNEKPIAHSIYQSAKLELNTRKMFPNYESYVENKHVADNEKALLYYQDIFPHQIKIQMPVKAILSLKVGFDESPVLREISNEISIKNLMLSTVQQLNYRASHALCWLKKIVAMSASYELILGRNIEKNIAVINELLIMQNIFV